MNKSITLTSSMRSNLSSLKTISTQMDKTQKILSSGKKVNSAIDNASSYYQARSLTNRANDLSSLLDSMSQSIQTIQAATQGIEAATSLVEQMQSIVTQAILSPPVDLNIRIPDGVGVISANMTTDEMQDVLSKGGIVALIGNITIDKTLNIDNDVQIIGNGTITYASTTKDSSVFNITANTKMSGVKINYSNSLQGAAITINGGKAEIDNLTIDATGQRVFGIHLLNDGELVLDNAKGITTNGDYSHKLVNGDPEFWDGEYNTDMIINQIGGHAPAAESCKEYVPDGVSETDENFGQGTWYLPAMGELYDLYGTDYDLIDDAYNSKKGTIGDTRDKVNDSLKYINIEYGVDVDVLKTDWYRSSSEFNYQDAWRLNFSNGMRHYSYKHYNYYVRPVLHLENCFDFDNAKSIEIGDIVYSDMSYGKVEDYDTNKTAVGIVFWTNEDKSSAKIIALKDISEGKQWATTDVDPDTGSRYNVTDIKAIKNYGVADAIKTAVTAGGHLTITNQKIDPIYIMDAQDYMDQYNECVSAYDELIKDASYQGVNLLTGGELKVTFNETRTHELNVKGKDISTEKLGIVTTKWNTTGDIAVAVEELLSAVKQLRQFATELGNNYTIIQTRQNFTEALVDVLETGSDELVLADMNEESANYLMLQTRQQLATNSLSLASQSASSILSLF